MKNIRTIKIRSFSITMLLEYVLAILVILDGNSVYRHVIGKSYHFALLSGLVSVLLMLNLQNGCFNLRKLIFACCLEIWALIYFLFSYSSVAIENYAALYLLGLPVMFLLFSMYAEKGKPFRLLYCFENILLLLAVSSVFLWLLGSVLKLIPSNTSIYLNWGREKIINGYFGLSYETARDTTFGVDIIRNSGIFTEAPMFSLWMCIALAIELFLKNKSSATKIIIFVIAVLTSLSSTGIVVVTVCFLMKYWYVIKKAGKQLKIALGILMCALAPIVAYYGVALFQVKSKTVSFKIRFQDYISGYLVWKEHPLFGSGFGNLTPLYAYSYAQQNGLNDRGYSNSIMGLLATGGLWLLILYLVAIYYLLRKKKIYGFELRAFGIAYLLLFLLTIFFARFVSVVFLAIGFSVIFYNNKMEAMSQHSVDL